MGTKLGGLNIWDTARTLLPLSNCLRRKYAAIIVRNGEVIGTGYNKSLEGCTTCARQNATHNIGDYSECKSIHAEQMALIRARENSFEGAELYLVCDSDPNPRPCPICQRMLDFAGIKVKEGG